MYDFEESDSLSDSMYDVEYCSIDDVINEVVIYKGITDRITSNGPRKLIAVTLSDGTDTAFITSSAKIIEQVGGMPSDRFPFRTMMKCVAYGGAFIGFKLFSPHSDVTDDDKRLFNQYRKTKFKK